MKINSLTHLPFEKRVAASCRVGEPSKSKKVYIYELIDDKDKKMLSSTMSDPKWEDSYYNSILCMLYDKKGREKSHFYAMKEPNSDSIMCISVTDERWPFFNTLEYIETAPKLSRYNKGERETKYIGQTMLSYLAKITKLDRKSLFVSYVEDRPLTEDFYYGICNFKHIGKRGALLKHSKLDSLIEANEKLTGSKIDITF